MKKYLDIALKILLIILLLMSIYGVYSAFQKKDSLHDEIRMAVREEMKNVTIPTPKDGMDAVAPLKNVDYFDGDDGSDATDEQVEKAVAKWFEKNPPETIKGEDGKNVSDSQVKDAVSTWFSANPLKDGLTPIIQCNEEKNRWEVKYKEEDNWQLLNGKKTKCTVEVE